MSATWALAAFWLSLALAGAELDLRMLRMHWKQASAIGLVSFATPFPGCAAVACWGLGWSAPGT